MKKSGRKLSYAHEQTWHLVVKIRQMFEEWKVLHPSPEFRQVKDIIVAVAREAAEAQERGDILEVIINTYATNYLPSLEEDIAEMKSPSDEQED